MSVLSDATPVRFGILGCARIAWKLARAMVHADGVVLHAVASRSLEKAQKFAETAMQLGAQSLPVAYGSYEEILNDADVDALYIPLPSGLHLEWVVKAAEHGKHILLEKPVAVSIKELDIMLEACDKAGVQIMDGTMWVHSPRAQAVRSKLLDKEFGELRRVNAHFFFLGGEEFMESNIRVQKGLDELGCLGDLGWYCVRAALFAKGYELPAKVAAFPGPVRNSSGVFISCGATLVWADGVVATFDCGFDAPLRQVLQICGSRATVCLDDFTIPHRETESSFTFEKDGAIVDGGIRTAYDKEAITVHLEKPQEALMVEALAKIAGQVKAQGRQALVDSWKLEMWKTMRVLQAVNDSASANGALVEL